MIGNISINRQSGTSADPSIKRSRDTIHFGCRVLSALAWIAIIVWIATPKGNRWASAAGDAGLAWILLTGGGYFAEQTMRSIANFWEAYPKSNHEDATCKNEEHLPK
jgi:hypothetical protein